MKKISLLLGTVAVVGTILYGLSVLLGVWTDRTDDVPPGVDFPIVSNGENDGSPSGIVRVRGASGEEIAVRDFRNDEFVEAVGDDIYILRDTAASATASFAIVYTTNDSAFTISLRKEPLGETRVLAEEALMRYLGVTRDRLCDLLIFVGVARDVNEFYAGQELGVSNCSGSQQL